MDMSREDFTNTLHELIADGLIECICAVCNGGLPDESLASLEQHFHDAGHEPRLATRNGSVVRRITDKGRAVIADAREGNEL